MVPLHALGFLLNPLPLAETFCLASLLGWASVSLDGTSFLVSLLLVWDVGGSAVFVGHFFVFAGWHMVASIYWLHASGVLR